MSFKRFLFWISGPSSVEGKYLCNFRRGHYGEHSCEIILNLDQWMLFKAKVYGQKQGKD